MLYTDTLSDRELYLFSALNQNILCVKEVNNILVKVYTPFHNVNISDSCIRPPFQFNLNISSYELRYHVIGYNGYLLI